MAHSKRERIIKAAKASLEAVDALDHNLAFMDQLAAGRQPAIDRMKGVMIDAHEVVRILWLELKSNL